MTAWSNSFLDWANHWSAIVGIISILLVVASVWSFYVTSGEISRRALKRERASIEERDQKVRQIKLLEQQNAALNRQLTGEKAELEQPAASVLDRPDRAEKREAASPIKADLRAPGRKLRPDQRTRMKAFFAKKPPVALAKQVVLEGADPEAAQFADEIAKALVESGISAGSVALQGALDIKPDMVTIFSKSVTLDKQSDFVVKGLLAAGLNVFVAIDDAWKDSNTAIILVVGRQAP